MPLLTRGLSHCTLLTYGLGNFMVWDNYQYPSRPGAKIGFINQAVDIAIEEKDGVMGMEVVPGHGMEFEDHIPIIRMD